MRVEAFMVVPGELPARRRRQNPRKTRLVPRTVPVPSAPYLRTFVTGVSTIMHVTRSGVDLGA